DLVQRRFVAPQRARCSKQLLAGQLLFQLRGEVEKTLLVVEQVLVAQGRRRPAWRRRRRLRRGRRRGGRSSGRRCLLEPRQWLLGWRRRGSRRRWWGRRRLRLWGGGLGGRRGRCPRTAPAAPRLAGETDQILEQRRDRVLLRPPRRRRRHRQVVLENEPGAFELLTQRRPDLLAGVAQRRQLRQLSRPRQHPVVLSLFEEQMDRQRQRLEMLRVVMQDLPHAVVRLLAQAVLAEDLCLGQQVAQATGGRYRFGHDLVGRPLEFLEVERIGRTARRSGGRRGRRDRLRRGRLGDLQFGLGLELPFERRRRGGLCFQMLD